jgi:hypothetical protein
LKAIEQRKKEYQSFKVKAKEVIANCKQETDLVKLQYQKMIVDYDTKVRIIYQRQITNLSSEKTAL